METTNNTAETIPPHDHEEEKKEEVVEDFHEDHENENDILMLEYIKDEDNQANMTMNDVTIDDNCAKLDFLGPIIINTDGTLSRIPNWNTLTPQEQANTLRLIAKRNKQRKEILEQQGIGVENPLGR